MHAAFKKAAFPAALMLAGAALAGCVVRPASYDGGEYYAEQRPNYVQPGYYYGWRPNYYYGSRPNYWHRHRWHGKRHHWNDDD